MEFDGFWATYAGYDPFQIIEKYADRCISLHMKDMRMDKGKRISTELAIGTLPLADYIKRGKEVGVKWFVVEQEEFTQDPLDSVADNAKEMKRLLAEVSGYIHLFDIYLIAIIFQSSRSRYYRVWHNGNGDQLI